MILGDEDTEWPWTIIGIHRDSQSGYCGHYDGRTAAEAMEACRKEDGENVLILAVFFEDHSPHFLLETGDCDDGRPSPRRGAEDAGRPCGETGATDDSPQLVESGNPETRQTH